MPTGSHDPGTMKARRLDSVFEQPVACNYLLFLPEGYGEAEGPWPLVLFLHGAGERGDDLDQVAVHGPPRRVRGGESFPFVLVAPQCPEGTWWQTNTLTALLDEVIDACDVDEDRVYLTGLSMGGFGTWALAVAQPDRFAAIAPLCGGYEPYMARQIAHVPAWVIHGAQDPVVPPGRSEQMVEALRAAGAEPKLTIYPDADHDCWTRTYEDPAFYEWLLAQRRPAQGR